MKAKLSVQVLSKWFGFHNDKALTHKPLVSHTTLVKYFILYMFTTFSVCDTVIS